MALSPEKLLAPIKKHPILVAGGVLGGGVVLYLLVSHAGGGGAAQSSASQGPSDAQVQAASAIQQAQIAAAAQSNSQQFQLAYLQQQQVEQQHSDVLAEHLAELQLTTNQQLAQMQVQSNVDIQKSAMQNALDIATIGAGTQLGLAQITADTQTHLADVSASVQKEQIVGQQHVQLETIQAQKDLGIYSLASANYQNDRNATMQERLAKTNAKAQGKSSSLGLIGGIASSIIGGIFSDERMKEGITLVDRRDDGLGIYTFRYGEMPVEYMGVMAQEVEDLYPEFVFEHPSGFLMVDYRGLGEVMEQVNYV